MGKTVEEMLAEVKTSRHDKLGHYLAQDAGRARKFWQFFDAIHADRLSIPAAVRVWEQDHDPIPVSPRRISQVLDERSRSKH